MNTPEPGKIEYAVRKVERFIITRFEQTACGRGAGSSGKGEYDNADVAYEVAYALCKAEHERLGWPIGDERIRYPRNPRDEAAKAA